MNKKIPNHLAIIIIFLLIAIIIAIILWLYHEREILTDQLQNADLILFKEEEGWGPCPPNSICWQSTKLYYSGKLVLEGEKSIEKQLDQEKVEEIKNLIKSSGIMQKDCSAELILDYGATYFLNLNGQVRTIKYPGCTNELGEIKDLID
jgi:hypothetical protein